MLRDDLVKELQEAHLKWVQDPGARPPLYNVFADVMLEFVARRLGKKTAKEPDKPMKVTVYKPEKW